MDRTPNLFSEFARMAEGARNAVGGLRGEIEGVVRHQIERIIAEMDLVPREEFEAARAMAAKARATQDALEKRVAALEAELGITPSTKKPSTNKKAAAKKPAARRAPTRKAAGSAKAAAPKKTGATARKTPAKKAATKTESGPDSGGEAPSA